MPADKEEFMKDWMRREEEMRTMFEYRGERSPGWNGEWGALFPERHEAVLQRMEYLREQDNVLEQQLQNQQRDLEWRKRFHVNQALYVRSHVLIVKPGHIVPCEIVVHVIDTQEVVLLIPL